MRKIRDVYNSDKYKALDDDKKKQVKGVLYDRFIKPAFDAKGVKGYTRDEWVSRDEHADEPGQFVQRTVSFIKGTAEAAHFGFTLTDMFTKHIMGEKYEKAQQPWTTGWTQKVIDRANEWQSNNQYMGDHWYSKLNNKVANFVAEQAPSLFAMESAGAMAKAGAKAIALEDIITNPKLSRIAVESASGYLYGRINEGTNKAGIESAVGFGAFATAGPAFKFISKMFGIGGRKAAIEALDLGMQKASGVEFDKIYPKSIAEVYDKLGAAGAKLWNEASQGQFKKNFNLLSKEQKQKVAESIMPTIAKAEERAISDNPNIATTVVKQTIADQAKRDPFFRDTVKLFEERIGPGSLEVANVEAIVDNNAVRTGKKDVDKAIKKFTSIEERKTANVQSQMQALSAIAGIRLGPGAANANDPAFDKVLLGYVKNTFKLENKQHQLVQLYGIRKEFAQPIQDRIIELMKDNFPNHTSRDWGVMVTNLDKHTSDVSKAINARAPNVTAHGPKVFRSTNILPGGSKSQWQKELQATVEAIDLMKKTKNHPDAQKAVKKVLKDIKNLGDKARS